MEALNSKLNSLGMAVLAAFGEPADPEATLFECLALFQEDRKLLVLILSWLFEYEDLIHIERVCALAKKITPLELAWLGGVASHIAKKSFRWKTLEQFAAKNLKSQKRRFPVTSLDAALTKRKGKDAHFEKFGLTIPTVAANAG